MSRSHHPLQAQEYITAFNKKVTKPAKAALNSDMVKKNIREPTKKFFNQPLVKEYITDPLTNASSGETASTLKLLANELKDDIKHLAEPLFPPGLTEDDVRESGSNGWIKVYKDVDRKPVVVENDLQRKLVKPWDDDTWEDDDESIFKPCSSLPSRNHYVQQFQDRNGQVQMATLDDITDDLLSRSQMDDDVQFRDTELIELTKEEKVLMLSIEMNGDPRFRTRDMEFNREAYQADIDNFAAAKRVLPGLNTLWPGRRRKSHKEPDEEIPAGSRSDRLFSKERERERVYTSDYVDHGKHTRQTSRGTYSESRNRRYIQGLLTRSIPRDGRGRPKARRPGSRSSESREVLEGIDLDNESPEISSVYSAGDGEDVEDDGRSEEDEEDVEDDDRSEEDEDDVEDDDRSEEDESNDDQNEEDEKEEDHKIDRSSDMSAAAQDFLAPSENIRTPAKTANASKTSVAVGSSHRQRDSGPRKNKDVAAAYENTERGRSRTRLGSHRLRRRVFTSLH